MNSFNYKLINILLLLSAPAVVLAQEKVRKDTTFKSQSLDFYSTYKPEIAPTPKPSFTPSLPVIDTAKPRLTYVVPEQTISYSYQAEPIKPLALKREREKLPFADYGKIGIGNNNTLLVDAGIGSLMGANYDATLHFNHLSQKGVAFENQKWSQNVFDAGSNFYLSKHILTVGLSAERKAYRQYGYNNNFYSFSDADIKSVYSGISLNAKMETVSPMTWGIRYAPQLNLYYWNNSIGSLTERNIDFSVPLTKTIDTNISVALAVNVGVTNSSQKNQTALSNNYAQIVPAINFSYPNFTAHLGIKPTWGTQANYFLPDINVSGKLLNSTLKIFAGWDGEFNQNSYRTLSKMNPYLDQQFTPVQGRMTQVFAGFETPLSSHLSVGATASYKNWKNLAMFGNNYATSIDGRTFSLVYEDMNAVVINAKALYQVSEKFEITGSSQWNMYDAKQIGVRAQQLPQIEIHAGFAWRPISKLCIGATIAYFDRIYYKNNIGLYTKLKPIADLGAEISYDFTPRFGAFVQFSNILNTRYTYWNQYPTLGFSVLGGLKIKF